MALLDNEAETAERFFETTADISVILDKQNANSSLSGRNDLPPKLAELASATQTQTSATRPHAE